MLEAYEWYVDYSRLVRIVGSWTFFHRVGGNAMIAPVFDYFVSHQWNFVVVVFLLVYA